MALASAKVFGDSSSRLPICCLCRRRYEPYVLGARALLPPLDSRFRGYGLDKVSWARSLQAAGFKCGRFSDASVTKLRMLVIT